MTRLKDDDGQDRVSLSKRDLIALAGVVITLLSLGISAWVDVRTQLAAMRADIDWLKGGSTSELSAQPSRATAATSGGRSP